MTATFYNDLCLGFSVIMTVHFTSLPIEVLLADDKIH